MPFCETEEVWTLMGKQAMARKRGNEMGGREERGGLPKAKRMSLKFASQDMKKEVKPQK